MSTSRSRFAGSIATRNVIGWSFPMTFPTWAKPSSESPVEIRSTAALSTWSVSARACGPNSRAREAASLAGGACAAAPGVATSAPSVQHTTAARRARIMSELIPDAETHDFGFACPGLVAQQLIIALERGVVGRLVGETESRDAPRQGLIPGRAGGNGGLRIVTLVPHERVQLLRRRRGERVQQVVRDLEVATGDPAADRGGVTRVDRLGVAHPAARRHSAEHERAHVVASVGREQRDRGGERALPEGGVGGGGAAVPERAAQLEAGPRPLEPAREGRVGEARLTAFLAAFTDPCGGRKPGRPQPVHEIHAVAQTLDAGHAPHRAYPDLPPRGGNHVVVEARAVDPIERRGLMRLVDDSDRREDETGAQRERVRQPIVEGGRFQRHLTDAVGTLPLGSRDLQLGAEGDLVVEGVGQVDDEALEIDRARGVRPRAIDVVHLAVATDGGSLLRRRPTGRHGGDGRKNGYQGTGRERSGHATSGSVGESAAQAEMAACGQELRMVAIGEYI